MWSCNLYNFKSNKGFKYTEFFLDATTNHFIHCNTVVKYCFRLSWDIMELTLVINKKEGD